MATQKNPKILKKLLYMAVLSNILGMSMVQGKHGHDNLAPQFAKLTEALANSFEKDPLLIAGRVAEQVGQAVIHSLEDDRLTRQVVSLARQVGSLGQVTENMVAAFKESVSQLAQHGQTMFLNDQAVQRFLGFLTEVNPQSSLELDDSLHHLTSWVRFKLKCKVFYQGLTRSPTP